MFEDDNDNKDKPYLVVRPNVFLAALDALDVFSREVREHIIELEEIDPKHPDIQALHQHVDILEQIVDAFADSVYSKEELNVSPSPAKPKPRLTLN